MLGREYRDRIHILKKSRDKYAGGYPATGGKRLSEIKMLYVVLVFLSSAGLILVWLNALTSPDHRSWSTHDLSFVFWALFVPFVALGAGGIVWVFRKTVGWSVRAWRLTTNGADAPASEAGRRAAHS